MSAELTKARQQLSQIKSQVKQGKLLPAAQAMHSALSVMLRSSLLSSERTEFEDLISDATAALAHNASVRQVFPLSLDYTRGQERELLAIVCQLQEILDGMALENAEEQMQLLEARRKTGIEAARKHLENKEFDKAELEFGSLVKQMSGDVGLLCEIGELYLNTGRYESAYAYFSQAIEIEPSLVSLYNRVGIALRKLNRYETAEKYYLKAMQYSGKDPNLLFNLGRLYIEWGKWFKAEQAANIILKLDPDFAEAGKLLSFARKKRALEEAAAASEPTEER